MTLEERIRRYADGPRPAAVVVDVGWVSGLAAIRSLGRAGVPVLALDHLAGALGFRSRYGLPVRTPDPAEAEDEFVALLERIGDALGRPAPIFATHDEPLNAIGRARERLGARFLYPFPEHLERIQTKRGQLEAADRAGVPAPRTAYPVTAADARTDADELGYPVLVKPSSTEGFKRRFGRQNFRCENVEELERAFAATEPFEPMVQEHIPGGDDALYTVGSYLRADGEPLGVFSGRKLLQTPPGIGTCRVGEAVWDDEAVDAALRLLRALAFHGLSQVELKRDARDGTLKLMEVNPRLWQWHALASASGVDLPLLAYADLLGERPPEAAQNGRRRRWAITFVPGEGAAFQRPPYVEAVLARDDLRPALVQAARLVRSVRR
jgi:predicted ATP-grasp superfamily ATP-dependent carboligase